MKNFIQPGDSIKVPAFPYTRTTGQPVLMGSLFGVATGDVTSGAEGQINTVGVYDLPKVSAQAWTMGVLLYWDDSAKLVTTVSTSNKVIGVAAAVAANPTSTGLVRLSGQAS